jgi:Tol biopolymer transport system component
LPTTYPVGMCADAPVAALDAPADATPAGQGPVVESDDVPSTNTDFVRTGGCPSEDASQTARAAPTDPDGANGPAASGRIAYILERYPQSVWTVNPDGGAPTQVVSNAYMVTWSPDGTKLAFTRFVTHLPRPGVDEIFVASADGSHPRRLVDGAEAAWSPDGKRVAYTCSPPQNPRTVGFLAICAVNADGTGAHPLTSLENDSTHPVWSPDGGRILYACANDLCVMRSDGTDRVRLTNNPEKLEYDPLDWSSQTGKILLVRIRNIGIVGRNDIPSYRCRLAVAKADGTSLRNLSLPAGACDARWSPDGTKLVFGREDSIWIGDADGANAHPIAEGAGASWGVSHALS